MSNKLPEIEQPLNANERFLYQCAVRLDALCHMMSSFLEVYAKQNNITTESNKVEEQVSTPKEEKVDVKSTPTQCAGKTKNGKRCKQTAKEGNDYCAIHDKG